RRILVVSLIEDGHIIDAHEFALKFLWCKFHQRFRKFEVDRLLADAAHDYGNFASHNDLLAQHTTSVVWPASRRYTKCARPLTLQEGRRTDLGSTSRLFHKAKLRRYFQRANVWCETRSVRAVICHATPPRSPRRKPRNGAGAAKLRGSDRLRPAHPVPRLHRRLQRRAARPVRGKSRCH